MYQEAAAIILVGIVLLLAYFANSFPDNNNIFVWVKSFFFGLSLIFIVLITSFGKVMLEDAGASADLISIFAVGYWASIIITILSLLLIGVSLLFYVLESFKNLQHQKKESILGKDFRL